MCFLSFFNDTATTEFYSLSLHDALPIYRILAAPRMLQLGDHAARLHVWVGQHLVGVDRKSTRLNSSHGYISYAVFCLKTKKKNKNDSAECITIQQTCDAQRPERDEDRIV